MSIKFLFLILICFFSISKSYSQVNVNRKKIEATRVNTPPKIDGSLDDFSWKNTPVADNFIMLRPTNGNPELNSHKTKVKLVYDDEAIYISAFMTDPDTKLIPKEFANRDGWANADFFMILINPNDDGQNPNLFIVTAAGVQIDAKVSNGTNEDYNWNAVWESAIKINKTDWIVEMKIPYRALRFANKDVQNWGFNFHRDIKNLNARYTWNHIDNTKGYWTQYDGLIENFKNITPPTRLTLYPYASSSVINQNNKSEHNWSAGLDLKYGITENFTLDATLIPDFGQTAFDNVQLNLGPFEQQFSEQRQFFTEGTELFNKGNLFYSRRIGGDAIDQFSNERELRNDEKFTDNKKINEEITNYPSVKMLNAIKVTGRTKKGLGVGVFNAITSKTDLTITKTEQTINGLDTISIISNRKETTNPFTNYNIFVLDQQFNKNSAVTLINTNVNRKGRYRDANVTGLLWHLEDKNSKYNIDGNFKMSNISNDINNPNSGYAFDTSIGKQSGNWRGEIGYNIESKDYNPNDLGILFINNKQTIYGFTGYRLLQPKGVFNHYGTNIYYNVNFLHTPETYTGTNAGLSFWSETKNRFNFGGNFNYSSEGKDFFEPRQGSLSGIYFRTPMRININQWGNTDRRKKLSFNYFWYQTFFENNPKHDYGFSLAPNYRFNNKFSLRYRFEYNNTDNDQGYVRKINNDDITENVELTPFLDQIIFGQRDRASFENTIAGKYSFNTNSSLSLTFRHNWSKVLYQNFLKLNSSNGNLETSSYTSNHNVNFNSWNLDLNYNWQFAPGSQLIAFYRHSIFNRNNESDLDFFENLNDLFNQSQTNTFSVRLIYFIDYNNLKKVF